MNSLNVTSVLLFLAIVVIAVFVGGKEINRQIDETIKENYQSEIEALKDKLNKQSELINSIINLENNNDNTDADTDPDTDTDEDASTDTEEVSKNEVLPFTYIIENGGVTITGYNGKLTTVNIPNKIEHLPVLKIGEHAFADSKIKSVSIPATCTEIDWFAFYGCYALTAVYIASDVKTIGYGAFDSCSKSITIYCERDSFAEKYAQSFGISYSYFK